MALKIKKVLLKYSWFPIAINQISTQIVDIIPQCWDRNYFSFTGPVNDDHILGF